jgi:hypothetical protein
LRKTKNVEKVLLPFHTLKTFGTVFNSFLKFPQSFTNLSPIDAKSGWVISNDATPETGREN